MKPVLIVGLGNPLAGDDGVGWHLAARLRGHPRLPDEVEVLQACDMLTLEDELEHRPLVLLIDALLDDDGPCGRLIPIEDFSVLETRTGSVHHLPPAQAIALLQGLHPEIREIPIILLGVTVRCVHMDHALSPALAARLDELADAILGIITERALRRAHAPSPPRRSAAGGETRAADRTCAGDDARSTQARSRPARVQAPGVATESARP